MIYRLQTLVDSPYALAGIAAFVLLVAVWYISSRQPTAFRAFDSDAGGVLVTRKAARELVQSCCEGLSGVGSARARVTVHRGEVLVRVALRLRRSANLKGISNYLREQIAAALTENLGIEKIRDVEITVVGILDDAPAVD